jgi:threonine synthase
MQSAAPERFRLICALCNTPATDAEAAACVRCGGTTVLSYHPPSGRPAAGSASGVWRYREWLPVRDADRLVSLGEGATPLVRLGRWAKRIGLAEVYAKLEFAGPTGSFKDRGSTVLLTHALAGGATHLVEDSSGNAGASMAAYAARAGIACTVYAPAAAPLSKLRQIAAYGAELVAVEGTREAVAEAAMLAGREPGAYYAGHNGNPYFVEGTKTFAFELIEAFGPSAVEHVVIPVGGGSLLWGCARGFSEWQAAGLCERLPKLHAVQSTGCMPIVAAYEAGAPLPLPVDRTPTIAGGITIEHPARGAVILRAVRESGGRAVAVSDAEIREAQRRLAELEGIFAEPTSAAAFAGLSRLAASGAIHPSERVVVAVTGSGLKDTEGMGSGQ